MDWLRTFLLLAAIALPVCHEPQSVGSQTDRSQEQDSSPKTIAPIRVLILGDRTGHAEDHIFVQSLTEAAKLKPDMILSVGDLIEGYQSDEKLDEADGEWDYVLGLIRKKLGSIPLFATPGNHDIWGAQSEALFEKRLGHAANTSFDIGDVRVIIFDTSRVRNESELSDESINWLVRELYDAGGKTARIVISHVPLFAIGSGGNYGSPLHDVFIAGRADMVIAGHWHHAMSAERDGVRYRMIGPSGTNPNRPGHPESGNFPQFGYLTIEENEIALSLIPTGAIKPADSYPYALNQLEWKIENTAVVVEGFEIDSLAAPRSGRFTVHLTNVTDRTLDTDVTAMDDTGNWQLRPKTRRVNLDAGKTTSLVYNYTRERKAPIFPGPHLSIPFPWREDETYFLKSSLRPTLRYQANRTSNIPTIDGDLSDNTWDDQAPFGPLLTASGRPFDRQVITKAVLSKTALFFGIKVSNRPKDSFHVTKNDLVSILVDPDPADFKCLMVGVYHSGKTATFEVDLLTGASVPTETRIVENFRVKTGIDHWVVELEIPISRLPIPDTANTILFNIGLSDEGNLEDPASWQPLKEHNIPSFGRLKFP